MPRRPDRYVICRDRIQEFAEKHLGRLLTNFELAHLPKGFDPADERRYFFDAIQQAIELDKKAQAS